MDQPILIFYLSAVKLFAGESRQSLGTIVENTKKRDIAYGSVEQNI